MARRGLTVTAVDNGPLAPSAGATGLVDHVRADGFSFRPPRPVDWLVCDMVEAPARVARLMGLWVGRGLCRRALFNWKLPNRDRVAEVARCEAVLGRELDRCGVPVTLRVRHLYHDRAEVTVYLEALGTPKRTPRSGAGERGRASSRRRGGRGRR